MESTSKLSFFSILFLLSSSFSMAQQLPSELLTPEIVSVNRMPMRVEAFAFETRELALQREKSKSSYYLSLNGNWKFNWVQNPNKRPVNFYKTDYNDASWKDFKVPANWEVNGFGLPIYVNQPYEFAGHKKRGAQLNPPFDIPEDNNPVGSYRRKFTVPKNWDGRQVFIHLGAVKSAFFIWVNGEKVGYSEDSKLAAEFDITNYVKPGENQVALQVYRWSDASYLECQDMWRISGIERDVYLYSTPKLDIRDFKAIATLDKSYKNGVLDIKAKVNNYKIDKNTYHSKPDTFSVELELLDAQGKTIFSQTSNTTQSVLGNYKTTVTFHKEIPAVNTWSSEIPYLYQLLITLKDKKGAVLEVIPQRLGFRSVELVNNNFLINGKRVFLKGVNRHEHNPITAHTLSKEDMRKDMEMMKKLNVNAVRHSHYPPHPYWMELCDEYGLYVVDEANIESHGLGYDLAVSLGNDKKWRNPHMDRITRMYERDKNYTSVVTWSLGNEAGNGVNFYEAYEWLKECDYRPVQYERAELDYNTDMIVPQYPDPEWLKKYAKSSPSRPLIMSEYAHIMGNSLGNFQEYWDAIESQPNLQGGFIWEWIDQALDTIKNGKRIMAYGGDFPLEGPVDENISDNNFIVKGVVTAYRGLTPMAIEVKKVHQFIKTKYAGDYALNISNTYFFRDLSNVQLNWELVEDGRVIEKGQTKELHVGPQQQLRIKLPVKTKPKAGKEYFLNAHYVLKSPEPFLEKNYEVAAEQLQLSILSPQNNSLTGLSSLEISDSNNKITIKGKDFSAEFDKLKGTLSNYSLRGETLIQQGPQPSYWRAPTDNDIGAGFNRSLRMWRNAFETGEMQPYTTTKIQKGYQVSFTKKLLNGEAESLQRFTIHDNGSIHVENGFRAIKGNHKLLLRVGNDLTLNKNLNQIEWYGRGPGESYWDRKSSSFVGQYKQTIDQQYFPYARPQESGNKSDVRWFNITTSKGKGLKIEFADTLLNVSALPYNLDDLDPEQEKKQYHSGELNKRNEIYMHIDLQQTGLQGIDSWGAQPMDKYRIPFADHKYSYWIHPIR